MKINSSDVWLFGAAGVLACVATLAAIQWPLVIAAVIGAVVLVGLAIRKPLLVSPALMLAALPFVRPNILSDGYAIYGTILIVAAALVAVVADKGRTQVPKSYGVMALGVALITMWLFVNAGIFGNNDALPNLSRGLVTTLLPVAAAGLVLADPGRRRVVGRGFVWIIILMSASFTITFLVWLGAGLGSFLLAKVGEAGASIYFPFTPSFGTQSIGPLTFPRFTGLGREPGWMSMYCGFALLLWPMVGRPNVRGIALLLAGLLGAFSTAGFGAFVVVVIVAWIMRKPKNSDPFLNYLGFLSKLAILAGSGWLAVNAPVFGFASKGDLNQVSLMERSNATAAGLAALSQSPLGGIHTGVQEGINLIASLAPLGIPFFVAVLLALFLPRAGHPNKAATTAPVLLIFITLLLSQPTVDSTLVFILTGLAYTLALPGALALNQPRKSLATTEHRKASSLTPGYTKPSRVRL